MNKFFFTSLGFLFIPILVCFFLCPIFDSIAKAVGESYNPSSNDLWNCLQEFQESSNLYDMLSDNGWIENDVTFKEFDYILVMTDQICSMNQNVRLSLVLAMIAVESRFDSTTEYLGARGLMQLMRGTAESRMPAFLEDGHIITEDDMFDTRLNLATGIDYINYILEETKGNEAYALMWYNQGPKSGSRDYLDKGIISKYASSIISLANDIEPYLIAKEG